jgi:hypothetical protein
MGPTPLLNSIDLVFDLFPVGDRPGWDDQIGWLSVIEYNDRKQIFGLQAIDYQFSGIFHMMQLFPGHRTAAIQGQAEIDWLCSHAWGSCRWQSFQ